METLKNLTLVQWIGIAIGLNSLLMGATPQLTVLFGTAAVPYIVAVATLGNGALGVFVTVIGGLGTQAKNVVAGGASIAVGSNAAPILATLAMDPAQNKIDAAPGAGAAVAAIAKNAAVLLAVLVLGALMLPGNAYAQVKLVKPTGNIINDIATAQGRPVAGLTGAPVTDAQNFFNARLLPDLQYAQKLAQAAKNNITADCYQAWIDIITTQQTAVKNADGTDIAMPDPHIITEFEKLVELRNALQPESTFMVKCSPVASMVKKDIVGFIGIVISGGAGLATLVPGL